MRNKGCWKSALILSRLFRHPLKQENSLPTPSELPVWDTALRRNWRGILSWTLEGLSYLFSSCSRVHDRIGLIPAISLLPSIPTLMPAVSRLDQPELGPQSCLCFFVHSTYIYDIRDKTRKRGGTVDRAMGYFFESALFIFSLYFMRRWTFARPVLAPRTS